jgi:hypothetical protein
MHRSCSRAWPSCGPQLAAIEARLAEAPHPEEARLSGPGEAALGSWALSPARGEILWQGQRARTKALLRVLIGEIRVASPDDGRPTYRVPVAVRIATELVAEGGFEPPTKGL